MATVGVVEFSQHRSSIQWVNLPLIHGRE